MTTKNKESRAEAKVTTDDSGQNRVPAAFAWLFALGGVAALIILLPFWTPVFLGATMAITVFPAHRQLIHVMRKKSAWAPCVTTLLIFLMIIAPMVLLIAYASVELSGGITWLQEQLDIHSWRELSFNRLPLALRTLAERALSSLQLDEQSVRQVLKQAIDTVKQMGPQIFGMSFAAVANVILMLLSCFFFLRDGPQLIRLILKTTPIDQRHTKEILHEFKNVASASLLGFGVTSLSHTLVVVITLWLADVPHVIFFGILTIMAALVPVVSSALIYVPVGIVLAATGRPGCGLGIILGAFVACQILENVIKPMVLGDKMAMHVGLIFLSALGGLTWFGPIGAIVGPLGIAFFLAFFRLYERDYLPQTMPERAQANLGTSDA